MFRIAAFQQIPDIRGVYRQHVIEFQKIEVAHLPRPLGAQVDPSTQGRCLGASIRTFADVIGVGARRIDSDPPLQTGVAPYFLEHALGRRRAAGVAHAAKEDSVFLLTVHAVTTVSASIWGDVARLAQAATSR